MTSTPAPTWWEDRLSSLRDTVREDPSCADALFSDDLLTLLADVEEAFVELGAETPGWEDPHLEADGERRASSDEEYSRCPDPDKFRILWSRAEAWARVLTQRGWADETVHDDPGFTGTAQVAWAVRPWAPLHRTTVLQPRRPEAQRLVLVRTIVGTDEQQSEAEERIPGLTVGFGDPAVQVETLPDCGCDACDSGSRDLLEQLDTAVLSIVDGSFEVTTTAEWRTLRTSFGGTSGSEAVDPDDPGTSNISGQVTAGPWAEGWTPRQLIPPFDPLDSGWPDEMLRAPWPLRVVRAILGALPWPLVRAFSRVLPGRRGTGAPAAYARYE